MNLSFSKTIIGALLLIAAVSVQAGTSLPHKSVAESAGQVSPLLNGQFVPDVQAVTIEGKQVSLKSVLNNKKTVLFFYRGGWCPFCNTQMGQLKQIEGKLQALGFQLIGISTDKPSDLKKSVKKHQFSYALLSDFNSVISQSFGLAYYSSQKVTDRYVAMMDLKNPLQKNKAGDKRLVLPAPAIYVVDAKGLVQFNYVNPNFKVRLNEQLLLKAAELVK